jgi:hypothetical protein
LVNTTSICAKKEISNEEYLDTLEKIAIETGKASKKLIFKKEKEIRLFT